MWLDVCIIEQNPKSPLRGRPYHSERLGETEAEEGFGLHLESSLNEAPCI